MVDRPALEIGDTAAGFRAAVGLARPATAGVRVVPAALPFRASSMGSASASIPTGLLDHTAMPMVLWDLHRVLPPGALLELDLILDGTVAPHQEAGRSDQPWSDRRLRDLMDGGGFVKVRMHRDQGRWRVRARRGHTVADTVDPDMDVLVVGLNPSLLSAERGVGFARPGNRFWPAAMAAGLVRRDRDHLDALRASRVGMTNLVTRATRTAAELSPREYRAGGRRLERLVRWLQPRLVCVVGVTGWRAAVDPSAAIGLQPHTWGGRPVMVMHNPSGLNAHATVDSLRRDFEQVLDLARAERRARS